MGETVAIVSEQIVVMGLVVALGFVLYRVGFVTDEGTRQMSDLVLYVANPILIAQALMQEFDPELLVGAGWVALLAALTLAVAIGISLVAYPDRNAAHAAVGRFSVTFTNAGFIGIPLALATVGPVGVFYISVANTVQTALIWTYGIWLVSGSSEEVAPKKILLNPALIAMVIGLACFLTSWQPPLLVNDALDMLGNLNTGMVTLVIGAYLGQCSVRATFTDARVYQASTLRLVLMPLVTIALLFAIELVVPLDRTVVTTLVMYQGMPVATIVSMFAHRFDRDGDHATAVVAASTLFTLVTLPAMMFVATAVL